MRAWVLALVGLVLIARPATAAVQSAWVQLGPDGAEARAVTTDATCPTLTVDGRARTMRARSPADADFPVTICRAPLRAGVRRIDVGGVALAAPKRLPMRILIFGDTGCRVKGDLVQDCNDPRAWPFATVVRRAAAFHPDLVIHVGDYYYRESPCPPLERSCAHGVYGDNWATWRADFFDPAKPLLTSAPFVFVRGNHEACGRGGPGWFRLLDAAAEVKACPAPSASFRVDAGGLNLYVLDSSGAEDRSAPADAVADISRQLGALEPDLARRPGWIVTHRPIWGLAPVARLGPIGPLDLEINRTEQTAAHGHDLSAVRMVVSGHIHHFAAFSFGEVRPAQLIVGTGGDVGEPADTPVIRASESTLEGLPAEGFQFDRFGYLLLDRVGPDWVGAFRDIDDRLVAACRLHSRRLVCRPAAR